jgi:hypothetical protein
MNPLKSLILEVPKNTAMSRGELAITCDYQNISKGLRHVDNYVECLIDKTTY